MKNFDIMSLEQKVEVVFTHGEWCGYRKMNSMTYNLYFFHGFFVELAVEEPQNKFVSVERVWKNVVIYLSTDENSLRYVLL